jgi:phospholipid-binding lipoprotein MlaA
VDKAVARPVARVYVAVTPRPVRAGVSNALANLTYPVTLGNDLLQGKLGQFAHDSARLVVNTTFGVGGLFDPATRMGLQANDEDFGQTLGKWGLPAGPYLMLPLLGPATVRDAIGTGGDYFLDPTNRIERDPVRWGLTGLTLVDTRASLLEADAALARYRDPYVFVRNAYLQRREFQVHDGNVPEPEPVEVEDEVEEEDDGTSDAEPSNDGAPVIPQAAAGDPPR